MRVEILRHCKSGRLHCRPGDVLDLDEAEVLRLCGHGLARDPSGVIATGAANEQILDVQNVLHVGLVKFTKRT